MTYTKTTWASGDIITAQKLNNLENGVEAANNIEGVLYVTFTDIDGYGTITCDKTGAEINAALNARKAIIGIYNTTSGESRILSLNGSYSYTNSNSYNFNFIYQYGYDRYYYLAIINFNNGNVAYNEYIIAELPA